MSLLKIKNIFYRTKYFWVVNKWLDEKPIFAFWKRLFKGSNKINLIRNHNSILLPTLPSFLIGTVLYSIFIVYILQLYNKYFPVIPSTDKSAITTSFLAAIASISGVFLGLYFAAISGIASSYLLRAPQNVKRFFLTRLEGQQYVRTVAITGIISIFYLISEFLGYTMHPVGLIFLSILAAYIIIRFWTVGTNVFYSLEPQYALPQITKIVFDSIVKIAPRGFQWNNPAIQNHHRIIVAGNLELIQNLVDFGKSEMKISDEQILVAIRYMCNFLYSYPDYKRKVPMDSYWYETKNQYQDWTLASDIEISIALNTGTTLQPKNIKDFTWFEEQTLDIAIEAFKSFSREKRILFCARGFDIFVEVAGVYAKDFDVQGVELLFKKLDSVKNLIYEVRTTDVRQHTFKEQLSFVDAQCRLATAALLGLTNYLDCQTSKNIYQSISKIDWFANNGSIYLTGLPGSLLPRFESLAKELKNERSIEDKQISPEWYIETLCFQQYSFSLQNYFNFAKSLHDNYFQSILNELIAKEQFPLAIHLIQRWKEHSSKYSHMIFMLRTHVEDCKSFHKITDLPWAFFDFDLESKIASDREREVTDKMIFLIPKLKDLILEDDLPDYFGQAFTEGIQACYQACNNNDNERLKNIFPLVFLASLTAYHKACETVKHWSQEDSKIIYSTEPIVNLLEISGYAKLYSELNQNSSLWEIVQIQWDDYLKRGVKDAREVIQFIADISAYRDSKFMIMPQETLRTNWKMNFDDKIRKKGFPVFPDNDSYDYINRKRNDPNHPSALIRLIIKSGGLFGINSARNVFFATYLSNRSEAEGVELPNKHNFKKRLEKEQESPIVNNEDE